VENTKTAEKAIPNIAMADALMKVFGMHRISPTDKELKDNYSLHELEYEDDNRTK
jgi:hypothetical protein